MLSFATTSIRMTDMSSAVQGVVSLSPRARRETESIDGVGPRVTCSLKPWQPSYQEK